MGDVRTGIVRLYERVSFKMPERPGKISKDIVKHINYSTLDVWILLIGKS